MADYHESTMDLPESPDPLASSLRGVTTPVRATRSSTRKLQSTPKTYLVGRFSEVERSESRQASLESPYKASHIIASSPVRYSGVRGESPWRIRVTVEAEPEESNQSNDHTAGLGAITSIPDMNDPTDSLAESFDSPLSRGRTTTTIIPLKGLDSPPEPSTKKGRGRPRKSGTPIQRNGTPVPKRRQSKGQSSVGKEQHATNDIDSSLIALTNPISASDPPRSRGDAFVAHVPVARAKRRGRRKEISPLQIATDSEIDFNNGVDWLEASKPSSRNSSFDSALRDVQINKLPTPEPTTDQSMDGNTRNFGHIEGSLAQDEYPDLGISKFSPAKKTPVKQHSSMNTGHSSKEMSDPSKSSLEDETVPQNSSKHVEFLAPPPKCPSNSKSTENRTMTFKEFDSIMESEGFSMISTASLPSVKEHLNSPQQQAAPTNSENLAQNVKDASLGQSSRSQPLPTPEGSSPVPEEIAQNTKKDQTNTWVNTECSSMINPHDQSGLSNIRSSPPARVLGYQKPSTLHHYVTPSANASSPVMPPPLQVAAVGQISSLNEKNPRTSSISPVVRAGKSLQSVVSKVGSVLGSPFSSPVKSRKSEVVPFESFTADPFSGFSQKTRRELGAGLRLGESIAGDNHRSNKRDVRSLSRDQDDVFTDSSAAEEPGAHFRNLNDQFASKDRSDEVRYPSLRRAALQLPSPAKSQDDGDAMDWTEHSITKRHILEPGSKVPIQRDTSMQEYDEDESKLSRPDQSMVNHSTLEDREIRWQRERERVSRSINQASSDEVIVIESSDVESEDDQLNHSSEQHSRQPTTDGSRSKSEGSHNSSDSQTTLPHLGQDLVSTYPLKPARGKIPSPWRRGRDGSIIYSDEVLPQSSPSKALSTIDESMMSNGTAEASPSQSADFTSKSCHNSTAAASAQRVESIYQGSSTSTLQAAPPYEGFLAPPDCISNGQKVPLTSSWQSNHYAALNYLWRQGGKKASPLLPFRHTSTPMESVTDSGSLYHTISSTGSVLGCRFTDNGDETEISQVEVELLGRFRSLCEDQAACWDDWYILGQLFAIVVDARNKRVERHLCRVPIDQDISGFIRPESSRVERAVVADQPLPDGEGNCILM
jgi:hypothetical protein